MVVKGLPTLIYVLQPLDGALDWIKPGQRPDIVPTDKKYIHRWLRVESSLLETMSGLSYPMRVLYVPRERALSTSRVEIRVQGILENANVHPRGELAGYVRCL